MLKFGAKTGRFQLNILPVLSAKAYWTVCYVAVDGALLINELYGHRLLKWCDICK